MKLAQPTPELPVRDLAAALAHYRDRLGFEMAWHDAAGRIAGVARGECAIFLRESDAPVHPVTLWIYAEDIDAAHEAFAVQGAEVIAPLETKPWGLRQFTLRDGDGHLIHVHHDR